MTETKRGTQDKTFVKYSRVTISSKRKMSAGIMKHIRTKRIAEGITQQSMADLLGISRSAYSKLEAGRRIITLPVFITLMFTFNFSIWELIDAENTMSTLWPRDNTAKLDSEREGGSGENGGGRVERGSSWYSAPEVQQDHPGESQAHRSAAY